MSVVYDILIQTGVYFLVFIGSLVLYNFFTKGFLVTYLRVKASRGKKVLVRIFAVTGKYYVIGTIRGTALTFKDRYKVKKTYSNISKNTVYDEMGIKIVDNDEVTGALIDQTDFNAVPGSDGEKTDNLITRALEKPVLQDKKEIIILALVVVCLIGIAGCIYMIYNLTETVNALNIIGRI